MLKTPKKRKEFGKGPAFIGTLYEKKYSVLLNSDRFTALGYIRRAALLLYPLKPSLWDEFIKLSRELLPTREPIGRELGKLKNEMEDL